MSYLAAEPNPQPPLGTRVNATAWWTSCPASSVGFEVRYTPSLCVAPRCDANLSNRHRLREKLVYDCLFPLVTAATRAAPRCRASWSRSSWFSVRCWTGSTSRCASPFSWPRACASHPSCRPPSPPSCNAEMVSVARQRLPLGANRRRHHRRPRRPGHRRPARQGPARQTRQGGTRVRRVPRRERLGHNLGSATAPARSSPPRSWNPRSTRSSANAWSRGSGCAGVREARLLLQIRTRVLNDTLACDYRRWYPDFTHTPDRQDQAA